MTELSLSKAETDSDNLPNRSLLTMLKCLQPQEQKRRYCVMKVQNVHFLSNKHTYHFSFNRYYYIDFLLDFSFLTAIIKPRGAQKKYNLSSI